LFLLNFFDVVIGPCRNAQWALQDLATRTVLAQRCARRNGSIDDSRMLLVRADALRFEAQVFINTVQAFIASQIQSVRADAVHAAAEVWGKTFLNC
jgi:hypothetical protein